MNRTGIFTRLREQPTEYKIAILSLLSPVVAFIYGYIKLKQRVWLISAITCLSLYAISIIQLPFVSILKLNMVFALSVLVGYFNLGVSQISHLLTKAFVSLAILSSPLYVLSGFPESISDIIFSSILVSIDMSLIWIGGSKVKLR